MLLPFYIDIEDGYCKFLRNVGAALYGITSHSIDTDFVVIICFVRRKIYNLNVVLEAVSYIFIFHLFLCLYIVKKGRAGFCVCKSPDMKSN